MKIISTIFITLLPVLTFAQASLSGEFRPRTEFRDGYRLLNTSESDPAFFTSQRTRLNFMYEGNTYLFKISGQDVRTWGEVTQLGDEANVNIHEAWAQLSLSDAFNVKLGRQELIYDDHRLLGSVNWVQQARSHDALLLKYHDASSSFMVDVGAAYNQEGENIQGNTYTLANYKVLSYLWMKKEFESVDISGLLLTDGFEVASGNVQYRYTYGTHLNIRPAEKLNASGTFYLQNGDDAVRNNISAFMAAAKVSYKINPVTVSGGIDYLSGGKAGDRNPAQGAFNTLYATNHKFYGAMDYFLNIPADTRNGGLQDIYASLHYPASEKSSVGVTYHHFSLANQISDPTDNTQTLDGSLASEVDVTFSYKFAEDVRFQLGYSVLFNDSSLERLQLRTADGLHQWVWGMLVISPKIL